MIPLNAEPHSPIYKEEMTVPPLGVVIQTKEARAMADMEMFIPFPQPLLTDG